MVVMKVQDGDNYVEVTECKDGQEYVWFKTQTLSDGTYRRGSFSVGIHDLEKIRNWLTEQICTIRQNHAENNRVTAKKLK